MPDATLRICLLIYVMVFADVEAGAALMLLPPYATLPR